MTLRAFEYRGGSAAKFWHVSQDGATVTVHFGRIGAGGRAKPKEFPNEAAAAAHLAKLVAEKLKKGYTEVAAPAAAVPPASQAVAAPPAPTAPDTLPDEDAFVVPASWNRVVVPRRGGIPGPAVTADESSIAAADALLDPVRGDVELVLKHKETEPEIVTEGRAYLTDGLAAATPLGVAAVTAALHLRNRKPPEEYAGLADAWVAARGVVFAAQVVAEWSGLVVGRNQAGASGCRCVRRDTDRKSGHWDAWHPWYLHAQRVRAHLAVASDDDYARARTALAAYRDGSLRQRAATSFLVPTETAWLDEDCRDLAAGSRRDHVAHVLWNAASTTGHLTAVASRMYVPSFTRDLGQLVTPADGARQDFAPVLGNWFDTEYLDADERRRVLSLLVALPGDESFRALLERLDQNYVQPAVLDAARRYPRRAVRLLAEAAAGTSAKAKLAGDLLRRHVRANPAAAEAVLPLLDANARQLVTAVTDQAVAPDAPADALPPLLLTPPWTTAQRTVKPVVVEGLTRPAAASMAWKPGERDEWLATPSPYNSWHDAAKSWERIVKMHVANPGHRHGLTLFTQGPEELARPLLPAWKPGRYWIGGDWMRCIVGRFELDALQPALHLAQSEPASSAAVLLPYAAPEVADLMADCLARLKSLRTVALAWLARHPAAAAEALIPAALGKPGAPRRAAEQALRAIVAAGHGADIREAAQRYGDAAADAVDALLAKDPLEILPAKLPKLPDWCDPASLPQVLLRDRSGALPRTSVSHVCTMLAMSKPGEVYAGIDVVKQLCDPGSLAEFAWALFQSWQVMGYPAKDGWVLHTLALVGDDETVRRLTPLIRAWPGEGGHSRAVAGLDVLAAIGTDIALMHLHGIAQKVKFKGLKDRAGEKVAEVAAELGLSADQLADRLVPDLGLDASGSLALDYGPRQFTVGFDEQLKPYVADADGTRRKALPKPGARDDQELAPAAYQRFAALKKDVRTIAADQILRLEQAMVNQRRWSATEFRDLFGTHPLLWHIVRRLVWITVDGDGKLGTAFRVAEDRTFADVDDEAVDLADDVVVGVAHPLHLGDAVPAWAELFADYEILQPFPQLGREVYALTDAQRAEKILSRFRGVEVATTKLLGLERRGWRRGEAQDAGIQGWFERALPEGRTAVLEISPGIVVGMVDEDPEQDLQDFWINDGSVGNWTTGDGVVRFGDLDPVTASELLRDLAEVTS